MKKTLILGMGNTIRGDDGAGIQIIKRLKERLDPGSIDIWETSEAGFNLLDLFIGYQRLIIVDSIHTRNGKPGDIRRFMLGDLRLPQHLEFSHNTGILEILAYGEKLKLSLPREVVFYTIEIEKGDEFVEGLTPKVKEAVEEVVMLIEKENRNGGN